MTQFNPYTCDKCSIEFKRGELTELFGRGQYACNSCIEAWLEPDKRIYHMSKQLLVISPSIPIPKETGFIQIVQHLFKWMNEMGLKGYKCDSVYFREPDPKEFSHNTVARTMVWVNEKEAEAMFQEHLRSIQAYFDDMGLDHEQITAEKLKEFKRHKENCEWMANYKKELNESPS